MSLADSIVRLAERIGRERFVFVCIDLLEGAERERYVEELRALTGHAWNPGDAVFDRSKWKDPWVRTWGARGLLHVWDDRASGAIVAGLGDEHDRPAEMCLKVATRHEVAGTGNGAALLTRHSRARVRVQALRCLAANGDSEHLEAARAASADPEPEVRRAALRAIEAIERRIDAV